MVTGTIVNRKGGAREQQQHHQPTHGQEAEKSITKLKKEQSQESENKQEFIARHSILDDWNEGSLLNKSTFKGFYVAGIMFGFFILGMDPILRYIKNGEIFPLVFYNLFKKDLFLCIFHWPIYYAFTYVCLVFQKAIISGYSEKLCRILQHICELSLFGYTMYISHTRDWALTHVLFLTFVSCTHYFKMHSYRVMNSQYRKEKDPAYPANISLENFTLYMWMPVLVYRHTYPRNKSIDYMFIVYKSMMTILGIIFGYFVCCDHLIPYLDKDKNNEAYWFETMLHVIFPFTILQIVIFWVVFENILNVFAEITRFADREFYQDWWNSTTFEEYNRKWNRPVHTFLYQHVYLECLKNRGFSRKVSQIVTFIYSSILHEWVFCLIFRTVKPVMTVFMLQQIPLFAITKSLKGKTKGNYLFWFGMIIGPALICIGYLRIEVV